MLTGPEFNLLKLLLDGRRDLTTTRAEEVERLLVRADKTQARVLLLHWGCERQEHGFSWRPSSDCLEVFCSPGSDTLQALLHVLSDRSAVEDVRADLFRMFGKEPALRAQAIELLFEPSTPLPLLEAATATLEDRTMPVELQNRIWNLAKTGNADQYRILLRLFWHMIDIGVRIEPDVEAWLLSPPNLTFAMRSFDYAWVGQAATELDSTLVRQSCEDLLLTGDRIIQDGCRIAMGLAGREYATGRREWRRSGGTA